MRLFLRGRWREAVDCAERLESTYATSPAGWHANAQLFLIYALANLGRLRVLRAYHAIRFAEADERGDIYMTVSMRIGHSNVVWLVDDDVDAARRHLREAMDVWPRAFSLQHCRAVRRRGEHRALRRRRAARVRGRRADREAPVAKRPPDGPVRAGRLGVHVPRRQVASSRGSGGRRAGRGSRRPRASPASSIGRGSTGRPRSRRWLGQASPSRTATGRRRSSDSALPPPPPTRRTCSSTAASARACVSETSSEEARARRWPGVPASG